MDSLTHIALGAALGTAVLGRKAGARAAAWGAACATLPDLDVLLRYGDPIRDFTFHRAHSHSLFWLTLASPLLALGIARLNRAAGATFREWWALVWLALVTHALLDAFTVYGTQLLLPFSNYPVGLGSIFIIDPLYTTPLLVGVSAALWGHYRHRSRTRWNAAGLALSTLYLAWTAAAQWQVTGEVRQSLAGTPLAQARLLVTPTPFNTVLWRVVVMEPRGYREGLRSLFDGPAASPWSRHPSAPELLAGLEDDWSVQRLAWFTKGFYSVRAAEPDVRVARHSSSSIRQLFGAVETASAAALSPAATGVPVVMTDLRMGQTPWFVFSFVVAEHDGVSASPVPSRQLPMQRPPVTALPLLWQRIWDTEATQQGTQP